MTRPIEAIRGELSQLLGLRVMRARRLPPPLRGELNVFGRQARQPWHLTFEEAGVCSLTTVMTCSTRNGSMAGAS